MRGQGRTSWGWSAGLVAGAALVLAACDSGPSGRAAQVTGPSVTSAERTLGDGKGKDKDRDAGGSGAHASGGSGDDRGRHRGRPQGELLGPVAAKAGRCPTIRFTVNGVRVRATGVTEFAGTTCGTLADGDLVRVDGQPLGNGTVLAREVELMTGAAPVAGVAGATVALVHDGAVAATRLTGADGRFRFEDFEPGVYDLEVTRLGASTPCSPAVPLAGGVDLVARRNEIEGHLVTTASPATCGTLVLARLEVRQGAGHRD